MTYTQCQADYDARQVDLAKAERALDDIRDTLEDIYERMDAAYETCVNDHQPDDDADYCPRTPDCEYMQLQAKMNDLHDNRVHGETDYDRAVNALEAAREALHAAQQGSLI